MTTERAVRFFVGFMILLSLLLGVVARPLFVSNYFLWVTVFVGANLFQSSLTQFCPLEMLRNKLGVPTTAEACSKPGGQVWPRACCT